MGRTLIRQPNGKLMIWSSIIDEPIYYDITEDEYVEIKAAEAREEAKMNLKKKNFIKDPCYINCLISAYGKDTEEIGKLIALLDLVGYDSKKIHKIINEQLAEQIEDGDKLYKKICEPTAFL